MKRAKSLMLIVILLLAFTACSTTGRDKPLSENVRSQSEPNSHDTLNQAEQSLENTEEVNSETILTEFTVEIYPAFGSSEPVDNLLKTFSLEMPSNWIVEDNSPQQYAFREENDVFLIAIIQGGHRTSDPEKPFEDVYEVFPSTVSITEIDVLDYPVLRHIIKDDNAKPPFYTYAYFIYAQDGLIQVELMAFDNSLQIQEKFDGIISSFTIK